MSIVVPPLDEDEVLIVMKPFAESRYMKKKEPSKKSVADHIKRYENGTLEYRMQMMNTMAHDWPLCWLRVREGLRAREKARLNKIRRDIRTREGKLKRQRKHQQQQPNESPESESETDTEIETQYD